MKVSASFILSWLVISFFCSSQAYADKLTVASFSKSNIDDWEEKIFANKTRYQLMQMPGKKVLVAESKDSASALIKEIRIDLKKYPYLNWSWSINNRLPTANEKTKSGDDYAARVYVIVDGGLFFWSSRAMSYVWSNQATKGEYWENAFAGKNVIMLSVRDKQDKTSTWVPEKRNVYEDLRKYFGKDIQYIDAVALMTDSDNSHGKVKAYYGDIYFSSH